MPLFNRLATRVVLCAAVALACAGCPGAAQSAPFQTSNRNPFVQIYGLPAVQARPLLVAGELEAALALDIATNYTGRETSRESVWLDGETYRTTFVYREGAAGGLEWGFDIPFVSHRGGFLDGFVRDWHDLFGLPQGGRDRAADNQLLYRYGRDGVDAVAITEPAAGVGDIQLHAALAGGNTDAWRAALKLPTGRSDRLFGSGGADLAVWWTSWVGRELGRPFGLYGGAGVLAMGRGDVLPQMQRRLVGFGSVGVDWKADARLTFRAQVDANTAFYRDTDLEQLGAASLQLGLGGTLFFARDTGLDIAVVEDLLPDTAPDVVFHLRLWTRR